MSVTFPVVPRGTVITPHLVRVGGDLVSVLGGPTQRITRIGSRYAADVELPTLDPTCAAEWLACPLTAEGTGDTLILVMPQMLTDPLPPAGLTGTGTAGSNQLTYVGPAPRPKPGMWFSFMVGGRNYLHLVLAVNATTNVLTVSPLLRVSPSATLLDFANPKLEGFCSTDIAWSLEWFRFVGHKFTITENA
jgi:hypothetical protein